MNDPGTVNVLFAWAEGCVLVCVPFHMVSSGSR